MLNILAATTRSRVIVNREMIRDAAEQSGLIVEVESRQYSELLDAYRAAFQKASSSADYERFIVKYRDADPENLVPVAEKRKQAAIKQKEQEAEFSRTQIYREAFRTAQSSVELDAFIKKYQDNDPEALVPKAKVMQNMVLRREDANRKREEADERLRIETFRKGIVSFRQNLQVGDESHCGLVEVKKPVAKVQTMIGEHWLKIEQLYPENKAACRFINGAYQQPGGLPL